MVNGTKRSNKNAVVRWKGRSVIISVAVVATGIQCADTSPVLVPLVFPETLIISLVVEL
jgi:hypothetical protein